MILESNDLFFIKKFVTGYIDTNSYLLCETGSRKAVLVDPGADDPAIHEYIKSENLVLTCIINTHGHADHIMGNAGFAVPIFIHTLDEECLRDAEKNLSNSSGGVVIETSAERTLKDEEIIKLGRLDLKVLHTPGHSRGGISIICGSNVFSGDTLFFEGIGRTDLHGGDYDAIISSIRNKLMVLPDEFRVFPGHGPETTIGHERFNNPYL